MIVSAAIVIGAIIYLFFPSFIEKEEEIKLPEVDISQFENGMPTGFKGPTAPPSIKGPNGPPPE